MFKMLIGRIEKLIERETLRRVLIPNLMLLMASFFNKLFNSQAAAEPFQTAESWDSQILRHSSLNKPSSLDVQEMLEEYLLSDKYLQYLDDYVEMMFEF